MNDVNSIAEACERIDLLEQENAALKRDNQRLRTELDAARAERDHHAQVASYYKYPHK